MSRESARFFLARVTVLLFVCCAFRTGSAVASGITQPNSALDDVETPQLLNVHNWQEYQNLIYGFSIRYPASLAPSMEGDFPDAISGQVVAFRPLTLDSNSATNLVTYSVLIGATEIVSPSAAAEEMKSYPMYATEIQTRQNSEINGLYFSKCYSSEGAAGHLYEKISRRVVVRGISYEIAMLIHSINLGAMSASVIPFDAISLGELFETMVRMFMVIE